MKELKVEVPMDNKSNIDIKKDKLFDHSRRILETKCKELKGQSKELKGQCKGNKTNRAEVEAEDIKLLYKKQILGAANVTSLLNTVWFNNGVFFAFRGWQKHSTLLLGDLEIKKDANSLEFVEFNVTEVWYSPQPEPVGKNKLWEIMKMMASQAQLSGRKVNHSTRKTFASSLRHSERPVTEVAQLGGWKSVSTLNHYNTPSIKQQNEASNIIAQTAIPDLDEITNNINEI
ncbi:unnamed protein product [Mytilus coruscus]|uniref:Tyr recombinase domain-containing protein n=1 Tax=Mytilus coruscus TaxID=42192 RepID=A0A6J8A6B7_MYTCO|nr:unnamed protein product [Mytilus coruscus]